MTLADLDRMLQRLRDAAARIATNLVEVERDPTTQLLAAAPLEGTTEKRWAQATDIIRDLWRDYQRLVAVLDDATRIRGTRSRVSQTDEQRLTDLLTGPSVEVDSTEVPARARGLLGSRRLTRRCSADDLLVGMSASFDAVSACVAAAAIAWDELVPRIASARSALETKLEAAAAFDPDVGPELASLRTRLDAVATALMTDPLSVEPTAVAELEDRLASLGDALLTAEDRRAELDDRLHGTRVLLDAVRTASRDARDAYCFACEKIARPEPVAPLPIDPSFDRELDEIVALVNRGANRGGIRDATERLDRLTELLEAARRDNLAAADHNRAVVDDRDRLRGRVDGYLAKTHAEHRSEDTRVTKAYDDACALLYTAPTDLVRARELVEQLQHAVSTELRDAR